MKRGEFPRQEQRNAIIAISAALFYLASAVINTLFSLVIFIVLVGAAVFLAARSYRKNTEPVPTPSN